MDFRRLFGGRGSRIRAGPASRMTAGQPPPGTLHVIERGRHCQGFSRENVAHVRTVFSSLVGEDWGICQTIPPPHPPPSPPGGEEERTIRRASLAFGSVRA